MNIFAIFAEVYLIVRIMGTVRLSLFMLLFLLQCGSISAREQEFPVDTVDMSDYRILPMDSLDFSGMVRSVPLELWRNDAPQKVVRAWGRLYVVYSRYDYQVRALVQDIEIFDNNGGYLGRLGYKRSEVPRIRQTNYVEVVDEGAPDYSQTYLSAADVVWNGSEIIVSDTAGRKVLWYDKAGNIVKKRDVDFIVEGLAVLDDGFLVGTGNGDIFAVNENKVVVTDGGFSQKGDALFPVFRNGEPECRVCNKFQSADTGYFVNGCQYVYLLSRHDGSILKKYLLDWGIETLPENGKFYPENPIVAGERYACGVLKYITESPDDEFANSTGMHFIADRREHVIYVQEDYSGIMRLLGYDGGDIIYENLSLDDRKRSIIFVTFPL